MELIRGGLEVYPERLEFLQIEAAALVGLGRLEDCRDAIEEARRVARVLGLDPGREATPETAASEGHRLRQSQSPPEEAERFKVT